MSLLNRDMEKDMKNKRGELYVLLSAAGFGLMPVLAKFAYKAGSSVSQVLLFRFVAASTILWIFVLLTKRNFMVGRANVFYLGILGIFGYDTTAIMAFTAFKYISAGLADLLLFIYPPIIIAIKYILYKEKISKKSLIAMALSTIGIMIIVWTPHMNYNIIGIAAGIMSAVFYSFYVLSLGSKRLYEIDGVVITTYITTFCTLGMIVYSFISGDNISLPGLEGLAFIVLISIISTVLPILFFCLGVKIIGSSKASIMSTTEPGIATFAGVVFLGEPLSLFTVGGGMFIVTGVILLNYGIRVKQEKT